VLADAVAMAILAIVSLLLATKYFQFFLSLADNYAKLLTGEAKMFILAAVALAGVFFLTRARARLHWFRLGLLVVAMTIDIFIGAGFVVGRVL